MKRALVIDDCKEFGEVVGDLLRELGFEATLADCSEEAQELCEKVGFDLILCDLVMPMSVEDDQELQTDSAMVGVHTLHTLSRQFPSIPIIVVSGALTGDPLHAMTQFGAVHTLSKPFGLEDLRRALEVAEHKVGVSLIQ